MTIPGKPGPAGNDLRRLNLLGMSESLTLVVLLFVAVPLKHVFGEAWAVRGLGPIHGLAFLMYLWAIFQNTVSGLLTKRAAVLLAAAAFIPFGFLFARRRIIPKPRSAGNP